MLNTLLLKKNCVTFPSTDVLTLVLLDISLLAKHLEETGKFNYVFKSWPVKNPWYSIIYANGGYERDGKWKFEVRIPDISFSGEATKQWVISSLMPLANSTSCVPELCAYSYLAWQQMVILFLSFKHYSIIISTG